MWWSDVTRSYETHTRKTCRHKRVVAYFGTRSWGPCPRQIIFVTCSFNGMVHPRIEFITSDMASMHFHFRGQSISSEKPIGRCLTMVTTAVVTQVTECNVSMMKRATLEFYGSRKIFSGLLHFPLSMQTVEKCDCPAEPSYSLAGMRNLLRFCFFQEARGQVQADISRSL